MKINPLWVAYKKSGVVREEYTTQNDGSENVVGIAKFRSESGTLVTFIGNPNTTPFFPCKTSVRST